jgi:hypothetical protein
MSIASTEKRQLRTAEYRRRMGWLVYMGKKYGPSVELYEAMIWLESQYRRLDALETATHSPDLASVLELFEDSRRALGPRDRMELLKGQFFRYVWRYEAAIEVLRPLVAGAADTSIRASAAVVLTRALLDAATYSQALTSFGSPGAGREMIIEAEKHLDDAVGVRGVSNEVAVLRARISVELGRTVEWSQLNDTFDLVFGSDYLVTAMKNLDELRSLSEADAADLGAAVEHDFTDSDLLVQFGQLYMRSAALRDGSDEAVLDLWRAYVVFDACRLLECSIRPHEKSTTSYLLGRAILAAATLLRDPNPFPVRFHGKKSLLHFAQGRLQSAAARSVGGFYEEAGRRAREAQALIRQLGAG